jgi:hypothetical protein
LAAPPPDREGGDGDDCGDDDDCDDGDGEHNDVEKDVDDCVVVNVDNDDNDGVDDVDNDDGDAVHDNE